MAHSNLKKSPEKIIRVLLVDDSTVFRRFLQEALKALDSAEVCGVANNGMKALDLVLKVQPDVILMDLEMPLMDGLTSLKHMMIHRPTPTIIFSAHSGSGSIEENTALKMGAVGFFNKADFFDSSRAAAFSTSIRQAVVKASGVEVEPTIERSLQNKAVREPKERRQTLVFCEECGARNVVDLPVEPMSGSLPSCVACGDQLIIVE